MARPVNQVLWHQWRRRIERQRGSGLSIAEFCRREEVSPHAFHCWNRKLRRPTSARHGLGATAGTPRGRGRRPIITPGRRRGGSPARPAGAARRPDFLQLPVAAVRPSPWIELALADGTVIRLPQQNLAALVTVLRVLRGELRELSEGESVDA